MTTFFLHCKNNQLFNVDFVSPNVAVFELMEKNIYDYH